MALKIRLPHNYEPRSYQRPLWEAFDSGVKRLIQIWHRRSGKDKTDINLVARESQRRVGAYYYLFPTYNQGKKILWDGRDKDGFRFIDHFPEALREGKPNESEMKIKLKNGSLVQIVGTDNIDSIVGTNPVGVVFSEYALQDPRAWDYLRPILAENEGWALFNYTPRGENHGFDLYEMAKNDPNWYVSLLTVEDTGVLTKAILEQEYKEIVAKNGDDALYWQEYYCRFDIPVQGSYYQKIMRKLESNGHITTVPYDPMHEVDIFFDIGVGDAMAIWFVQSAFNEVKLIDYHEESGEGLAHYKKVINEKGYRIRRTVFPHDAASRSAQTGKSLADIAEELGFPNVEVLPRTSLETGIEQVRLLLPRCYFDKVKCKRGITALKSYHKKYDEMRKTYLNHPEHDWSSHGSDAFRTMAMGFISGFETQSDGVQTGKVEQIRSRKNNYTGE